MTSTERASHFTQSVGAARTDARSREGSQSEFQVYVPASTSPYVPHGVRAQQLTWSEIVAPGGYAHRVLARGTRLRLDDPTGDACAHVVLLNALEPTERLNVADTQKIPWQAYITTGHPLLSGDGRVLATVVEDSSAHHDAFCGTTTATLTTAKYGAHRPESASPAGQDLLALAAAKHGLTRRDVPPGVSFFQGVRVGGDGELQFRGSAGAGTHVDLVAEMPVIVLLANVPHPLDPRPDFVVGPLRIHAWSDTATGPDSAFWAATPERTRAYENTLDYLIARGAAA